MRAISLPGPPSSCPRNRHPGPTWRWRGCGWAMPTARRPAIERALSLAPNRADILLLASRLESARGHVDASVALLRRATAADATDLRARFALVEELDRAGQADAGDEVPRLLDDLLQQAPSNLAVVVERARMAARRADAERARDSVMRLEALSAGWPPIALEQLAGLRQAVAASQWTDAVRSAALLRNVLARVPAFGERPWPGAHARGTGGSTADALRGAGRSDVAPLGAGHRAVALRPKPWARSRGRPRLLTLYGPEAGPTLAVAGATGLRRLDASATPAALVAGRNCRRRRAGVGLESRLPIRRRGVWSPWRAAVPAGGRRQLHRPDAGE